jgi:hypothetical protein
VAQLEKSRLARIKKMASRASAFLLFIYTSGFSSSCYLSHLLAALIIPLWHFGVNQAEMGLIVPLFFNPLCPPILGEFMGWGTPPDPQQRGLAPLHSPLFKQLFLTLENVIKIS